MGKVKFITFTRASSIVSTRLTAIKTQLSALIGTDPLNAAQRSAAQLLVKEATSKYEEFNKRLNTLQESECDDYDDDAVARIESEISDLHNGIQGIVASNWPNLSGGDLDSSTSDSGASVRGNSHLGNSTLKLPKISIPKFDGSVSNWTTFYNLFDTLVHQNPSLSNVEKLQYLFTSLELEALNEIKSLTISNENYQIAWDRLIHRYHNKRRLITFHLNQIIDLPSLTGISVKHVRSFISTFNQNAQALVPLGTDVNKESPLLVTILLRKVDPDIRRRFETTGDFTESMPTSAQFLAFLEKQCIQAESANLSLSSKSNEAFKPHNNKPFSNNKVSSSRRPFIAPAHSASFISTSERSPLPSTHTFACFVCKGNHKVYACEEFKNMDSKCRLQVIKDNKRCFSCLGTHQVKECRSKNYCLTCNKKHHTLLHFESPTKVPYSATNEPVGHETANKSDKGFVGLSSDQFIPSTNSTVLLSTALVKVTGQNGSTHVFRALLDSGSMCDFLSERAAQLLKAPRIKASHSIVGISQVPMQTKGLMPLKIESLSGQLIAGRHPFLIISKISYDLPRTTISSEVLMRVKPYTLADPTFYLPGGIDLLLGGSLFPHILTNENYPLGPNMPNVIGTKFGFVVMGRSPCSFPFPSSTSCFLSTNDVDLHTSLQRFWNQEEPPVMSRKSQEEILCDEHFAQTHSRDSNGRYCVRLPFKPQAPPLGDSRQSAEKRFRSLENKFKAQPEFKELYSDFMKDYNDSGHMEKCNTPTRSSGNHYFLPHHGVLKASSSTTKLRTVFDASCRTSNGISLNDILLTGPKLQTNISDILMMFRCFSVVFTCDIRQMYRQIQIHPDDQNYQLILWREEPHKHIDVFKLTTVTYGMNSSPYLAIRTLHQLAKDEGAKFPLAAEALRTHTYVDDVIAGADTEESALKLQEELTCLLQLGGFELRKWTSNSTRLLQNVPFEHLETPSFLQFSSQPQFSVLGIHWSPSTDCFTYNLDLPNTSKTKRQVLSVIAQIYDPCGFLSPITMWAKCFMQILWSEGHNWDQPLPTDLLEKWTNFVNSCASLKVVCIPRPLKTTETSCVQIHGFADASECGYAAVIYFRCQFPNGSVTVRQVISKTRVAPLKRVTLPRLELCAAHLLAQLVGYCQSTISKRISFSKIFLWSDSTVALTWIQTPPFRLKTYVANRVAQVQEIVPPDSWNHVRSDQNPADCASRGLLATHLVEHPLWWNGPSWLKSPPEEWPTSQFSPVDLSDNEETKKTPLTVLASTMTEEWDIFAAYSSWIKLQRVVAYILRFLHNAGHQDKRYGLLTAAEMKTSQLRIFKLVQASSFREDIEALKKDPPQHTSAQLRRLSPFMDDEGILRVGGRLNASDLSSEARHPVILPKRHCVVNLLIDSYHKRHLHSGAQLTQSLLSQVVWILSARSVIRSRIFRCVTCFKVKPRNTAPLMGNLPKPRVTQSRPFLHTGTDYAGPFNVKVHNLRSIRHIKVYLCVFVCLVTKACHLEVVTDLTADGFIASLTRFTSRRGLCTHLYSDCGTNFVGAESSLRKVIRSILFSPQNKRKIQDFTVAKGITFHFNPPAAPHQGGLWESCVKSAKHHLRRVMGETVLTLIEFITLTNQVEAMLNSRPLTPLSNDPMDINALTPGHFLIGSPLVSVPETDLSDTPSNRLKHWQLVQALHQRIWHRWHLEYLNTLQQRFKWNKRAKNLEVGDLVLVHTNSAPLSWPLARITSVFPGPDGVVRVVQLKTQMGTMTRPVHKVFPLPNTE